jgi:hypothetical protein
MSPGSIRMKLAPRELNGLNIYLGLFSRLTDVRKATFSGHYVCKPEFRLLPTSLLG